MLSGFTELDELLGGFRKGELTIIAGRPGIGKTALCWSMGANIAQCGCKVIMFYQNEGLPHWMPNPKVLYTTESEFITVHTQLRLNRIINYIKTEKEHNDIDAVFIPNLPLRTQSQTDVTLSSLRGFAGMYDVSILLEYPVKPTINRNTDKRPRINHLRYPKTIKLIADNILFVYREDHYDGEVKDAAFEVNVAKSANGKFGTAFMTMQMEEKEITISFPKIIS